MKRVSFSVWTIVCVWLSGVLGGQSYGEIVSVDLVVLPESRIDATVTMTALGQSRHDSDTTTVTGNVTAELGVYFDADVPEVADANSIRFTGGALQFSDMSFTLDFSFFGKINASATGLGGRADSPSGAGIVSDGEFDMLNHVLIFDKGEMHAAGTGTVGGLFEPMTIKLSDDPMALSGGGTGNVSVALESLDGYEATYSVTLVLPVSFDEIIYNDEVAQIDFSGDGVVTARGYFVRSLCSLRADLAWEDCVVDEADLAVFAEQWLGYGDVDDCGLSADLSGGDCYVDFADFAVLASEWVGFWVVND